MFIVKKGDKLISATATVRKHSFPTQSNGREERRHINSFIKNDTTNHQRKLELERLPSWDNR